MRTAAAVLLAVAALAAPAVSTAQDVAPPADDWDVVSDPARQLTLASVGYSSGPSLAVRCLAGQLDVLASGLPDSAAPRRPMELTFPGGAPETQLWHGAGPATAIADAPAPNARRLRRGGAVELKLLPATGETGPARRYVLDLPAASIGVDQVLAACDQPLTDPRDDLPRWNTVTLAAGEGWARLPAPEFPQDAMRAGVASGRVLLSCVIGARGQPEDCRVERASDPRFIRAAVASMTAARVNMTGDSPPRPGQVFLAPISFRLPPS